MTVGRHCGYLIVTLEGISCTLKVKHGWKNRLIKHSIETGPGFIVLFPMNDLETGMSDTSFSLPSEPLLCVCRNTLLSERGKGHIAGQAGALDQSALSSLSTGRAMDTGISALRYLRIDDTGIQCRWDELLWIKMAFHLKSKLEWVHFPSATIKNNFSSLCTRAPIMI